MERRSRLALHQRLVIATASAACTSLGRFRMLYDASVIPEAFDDLVILALLELLSGPGSTTCLARAHVFRCVDCPRSGWVFGAIVLVCGWGWLGEGGLAAFFCSCQVGRPGGGAVGL